MCSIYKKEAGRKIGKDAAAEPSEVLEGYAKLYRHLALRFSVPVILGLVKEVMSTSLRGRMGLVHLLRAMSLNAALFVGARRIHGKGIARKCLA